jgi:hypothetical protein
MTVCDEYGIFCRQISVIQKFHISVDTKRRLCLSLNRTDVESISSHVFRDGTNSQNSPLLHDMCRTVCELQLSYMDENAVVLLHLVLLMQARPFAMQVEPTVFQRCLWSDTSFVWLFDSVCIWHVLFLSRIIPVA